MDNYIVVLGKQISFYSIIGFVGLLAALLLCLKRRRIYDIEKGDLINLFAYSIVGIVVGSKLLALICMIPDFIEYWDKINWNNQLLETLINPVRHWQISFSICSFRIRYDIVTLSCTL